MRIQHTNAAHGPRQLPGSKSRSHNEQRLILKGGWSLSCSRTNRPRATAADVTDPAFVLRVEKLNGDRDRGDHADADQRPADREALVVAQPVRHQQPHAGPQQPRRAGDQRQLRDR